MSRYGWGVCPKHGVPLLGGGVCHECTDAQSSGGDGTPGPAREGAPSPAITELEALASMMRYCVVGNDSENLRNLWSDFALKIAAALRAELARAPNGWEEAAKIADEHAALYRQRTVDGSEYSDIEAHACEQLAVSLRAAAPDAERREPAP